MLISELVWILAKSIEESKNTFYGNMSRKLVKQNSNPETCWPVLKRFLNNDKISCISSIFHENDFQIDTSEKNLIILILIL